MRLSENITNVFLSESGELTVREVLERSEHRGFGFLLVILSFPVALPFTPPGVSAPFAVLIALLACQMIAKRVQPWFPERVMKRKVKTGDTRFMRMMHKWARFFERFLRPRAQGLFADRPLRYFLGPVILLASVAMLLPFPGTNSISSGAVLLIGLGMLEEDGAFGIAGVATAFVGFALAAAIVVVLLMYGPQGMDIVKAWFGR